MSFELLTKRDLEAKKYNPSTTTTMNPADNGRWYHCIDVDEMIRDKDHQIIALKKMIEDYKAEIDELTKHQQLT